ncbi:MAG: hypothetical protein OMM_04354 [Candidatus Magnetoglobus multicellularis str. Araruama]|uniref:Cohesin domain-containing protein n=1 Tax=Candidatus Magnetoglobus multicellularis str. Araruama TaxID=890399 RepID=A0A1V1P1U7_9BACT|nr:MAG: hypothetical protein OMM_04354 [Candidatus Magnetoglobus multicellularis str. Araruama]
MSMYKISSNLTMINQLDIQIIADGLTVSNQGAIAYIDFEIIGMPLSKTILSLDFFNCNEITDSGGFGYGNSSYDTLIISIDHSCDIINDQKIGLDDALFILDVLPNNNLKNELICQPSLNSAIRTLQIISGFMFNIEKKIPQKRIVNKKIADISKKEGDIFTVPVIIDQATYIDSVTMKISFDESVVDAKSITTAGGILEHFDCQYNLAKDNSAILIIYTDQHTYFGSGSIAFITFEIKDIKKSDTDIIFTEFTCNEKMIQGGFQIDNNTYDIIHLRPIQSYTITASSNGYGTITPNGIVHIDESSDMNLFFEPNDRFQIKDVLINGQSFGNISSYSLTNIQQNYDFFVRFSLIPQLLVTSPIHHIQTHEDADDLILDLSKWAQVVYSNETHAITQTIISNSNPDIVQAILDQQKLILHLQPEQSGAAHIQLMGESDCCAPVFEDFTITVMPVNDPPKISSVPTQTINEGQSIESISLTITDIDSPTDNIRLWATSSNPEVIPAQMPNIVFNQSEMNHQMIITPVYPGYGDVTLTVFASDGQDQSSISFLVSIRHVEYTIRAIVGQNGKIGRSIRGNVSDNDGIPISECLLSLWGKKLEQTIYATTDSNGDYTFSHLPTANLLAITAWPSSGSNYLKKDYCETDKDFCLSTIDNDIDNLN